MHITRDQSRLASSRSQQALSAVSASDHTACYAAAPGDVSYSPTAATATSHSPSILTGSRRARDSAKARGEWVVTRAQQYAGRDDDYVQYHGPISPNPTEVTYSRTGDDVRKRTMIDASALDSLIGLGLTGTTDIVAGRKGEHASQLSRPLQGSNQPPSVSPPVRGSEERPRAVMQAGLPSAYTHGGSAPSDWSYAPRSGAISDGLPASMRFDNHWHRESPSSKKLGAFRREPFPGSPGFAQVQQQRRHQQQQQQQQQQSQQSVGQSGRAAPPPTSLNHNSGNSSGRRSSASSSSPTTATAFVSQPQQQATSEHAKSLHRKDSSLASSEGHASSITSAHHGAQYSAGTSLSSLRDLSSRKNSHASIDMLRANNAPVPVLRSIPTPHGSFLALPATDAPSAQSRAIGSRSLPMVSATHPVTGNEMHSRSVSSDHAKGKAQEVTFEIASSNGHSSAAAASSHSPSNSFSAARAPAGRHEHVDNPSSSSSSSVHGDDGRAAPHTDALLVGLPPANLRRLRTRLSPIPSSTYDTTTARVSRNPSEGTRAAQQRQHHQADEQAAPTMTEADDAHRHFVLLQQLHLDEMSAHAVENGGWLDSKNGCERVLMPRPSLHENPPMDGSPHNRQRARSSVAFERNRHQPIHKAMEADDSEARRRAQALLSRHSESYKSYSVDGDRRLFHHRMPPATPTTGERILPKDRPQVPERTSSRQGRRSRARSTNTPQTPALTPHALSSDDDEEYGVRTPDVHTVLAQGRALDEERAQWRAEHRRSIGATTRATSHRRVIADRDNETVASRRSLRNVRSSPNLRWKDESDGKMQPPVPTNDFTVPHSCFPTLSARESEEHVNEADARQKRTARMRSRSLEGLSRLYTSAINVVSHAMPCIASPSERHGYSTKGVESFNEKREWHQAGSLERKRRLRATTMLKHDSCGSRHTADSIAASDQRKESQQPFVIGRMMFDEGTSPGLGEGTYEVVAPSWTVQREVQHVTPAPVAHFGAAISSPRPDIGGAGVTPDRGHVAAGRHVTQHGYHHPRSSDELAAFLRAAKKRQEEKKPVSAVASPPATSMMEQGPREAVSLPVPPRRRRSSHGGSAGGAALSAAQSPSTTATDQGQVAGAGARTANTALPGLPLHFFESYAHPGAFQTPPLTQPVRDGEGWFDGAAANSASTSEMAPSQRRLAAQKASYKQPSSLAAPLSIEQEIESIRSSSSPVVVRTSEDSASQHSRELWNTDDHADEAFSSLFFRPPVPTSTGDAVSLSTRSGAGRSRVGRRTTSTGSRTPSTRGKGAIDDGRQQQQLLTASFDQAPDESPNEDDSHRDEWIMDVQDEELQQLMGNLLVFSHLKQGSGGDASAMQGEGGFRAGDGTESREALASGRVSTTSRPSLQEEAAWNESSLGGNHHPARAPSVSTMPMLDRHVRNGSGQSSRKVSLERGGSLRIGRVDERQPRIEAAYGRDGGAGHRRTAAGADDTNVQPSSPDTSEGITPRAEHISRPRLDSMEASVLLHGSSVNNDEEPSSAALDFIDFASPINSARLSLPSTTEEPIRTSTYLELPTSRRGRAPMEPRDSVVSNDESVSSGTPSPVGGSGSRRGSEGLLNMMRSRVWPTPPDSPGPNQMGRGM